MLVFVYTCKKIWDVLILRKSDYAKLFTRRKDGVYQKYVSGKYLYSKDPEELYKKWQSLLLHEEPEKTFSQVADIWENIIREQVSERTWLNYKPHLEYLISRFGTLPIAGISAQDIDNELKKAKALGYSATIIKTRKTILNQIFNEAIIMDLIKYNPVSAVKTPKGNASKRSAPTEAEMRIIFNSLDVPFGFFPYLLLCTGLRKGEALALTKQDVDLKRKEISVTKALVYNDNSNPSVKKPKTESGNRTVPIVNILIEPLKRHMEMTDSDLLFPSPKSNRNPGGGYMTEKSYDTAWANYCKITGLNITAHQLRHGAATIMFESNVDVQTAKRILGHSQITTTMAIYTDLREQQQMKSIKKLDKGLSKYVKEK